MTRADAIIDAYMLATGKSVSTTTSIPAAKRNLLTGLAIKYYRDWQTEPGMEWESLYSVIGAGTVTATDTFELDSDINFIAKNNQRDANFVRVRHTDGVSYTDYATCTPGQLYQNREGNFVAKVADNSIKFSRAFTSADATFGGTIQVPAILKLDDLTTDTTEVLIDNPNWLAERMSAQYCLSFKSLRVLYPDRLDAANELMMSMKAANSSGNESTSTGVDYFASMGNVC